MIELLTVCKRILNRMALTNNLAFKKSKLDKNDLLKSKGVNLFKTDLQNRNKVLRPFRISVEGNVGAGKSTVLNYFAKYPGVETYPEPIDWWRNLDGHNLLDLLYKDMNTWYNVFQKYVQLTRVQVQTTPPKDASTTVQIFERSVQNNRHCFVEQAVSAGHLIPPQSDVLDQWYQWIEDNIDIEIDLIVYLRTTPEVVYQRIMNRGRREEATVPFDYIKELHESHERWLLKGDKIKSEVCVINADTSLDHVLKQCELHHDNILRHALIPRTLNKNYKI